ncbi:YggT family protein [Alkalibacter mobilis]|uniref:YggT family protein n=1 Tax=Alkalibacter mobilis TaxID=2787712 RepID=UPI0018A01F5A|nr:YggT family protein [Alkalibacter mobilis]MBF7095869.1 YggT family protein [Alkalibacter mobilis]
MSEMLIRVGNIFFVFLDVMIILNLILGYINSDGKGNLANFVHSVTEPMLKPFRKFARIGAMDFSPFAAVMFIEYIITPLYKAIVLKIFG